MRQILILILFSLRAFATSVYGGFWDSALETVKDVTGPKDAGKTVGEQNGLTDQEILTGLREALNLGVQRAVERASASGGFMDNSVIHIPLPGYLQGDTAATDYFREKTWQPLSERFQPIVHATSQTVGVTQSYLGEDV